MDPLESLTKDELLQFFHRKKTQMSCIDQHHTFLNQLRDYDLITDTWYQKVMEMETKPQKEQGLYNLLDWVETEKPDQIKIFWSCMFEDHILQCYPVMRLLRNILLDEVKKRKNKSENLDEEEEEPGPSTRSPPSKRKKQQEPSHNEKEETSEECKEEEKRKTEVKNGEKMSKSVDEEEEEPGPSTRSPPSKRKKQQEPSHSSPIRKGVNQDPLPVTCGNKKGKLYPKKMAKGEACILSEGRWFSPWAFGGKGSSRKWKTSICWEEIPLQRLIEEGHLTHQQCRSRPSLTSQGEKEEQENDDHCSVCGQRGSLLCCDRCPRAFHNGCHLPTVDENMLGQEWLCTYCILRESQGWRDTCERSHSQAMGSGISNFKLECQYLLLWLYCADEDHIFSSNPCATVPRYRRIIKRPMWLDKVAEKLQEGKYSTVGQFVSDIRLIFTNCAKFNRDTEFGQLGAGLRDLFEEEFLHVFSVKN